MAHHRRVYGSIVALSPLPQGAHPSGNHIQPLSAPAAALLFVIPSVALFAAVYVTIPWSVAVGVPLVVSVPAHFITILGGMLIAAVAGAKRDLGPHATVVSRLRLRTLSLKETAVSVLLGAFMLGTYLALGSSGGWLFTVVPLDPPAWLGAFITPTSMLGVSLAGNWSLVGLYFAIFVFNVAGEELWWRGYILPRQEAQHGSRAWLLHAVYWDAFHWFFFWDLLALLPSTLALSYVAQRTRATVPALIGHAILNSVAFVRIITGVLAVD